MAATANYLAANKAFSSSRPANQLPLPPSKQVLVLTCMDARILPEGKTKKCLILISLSVVSKTHPLLFLQPLLD